MKVTCQFCRNQWFLTNEAIVMVMENSPKKGRSMGVECPRCRKLVKIARPKRKPQVSSESASEPDVSEPDVSEPDVSEPDVSEAAASEA